jgi:hypothetical protein
MNVDSRFMILFFRNHSDKKKMPDNLPGIYLNYSVNQL